MLYKEERKLWGKMLLNKKEKRKKKKKPRLKFNPGLALIGLRRTAPSSSPWILYSRWQPRSQLLSWQSKMQISLFDACSVANVSTGVLGTWVNPETCRIRVDGRIRFQTWKFLNPEGKSCGFANIRVRVARHKALSTCIRIFLKPETHA